MRILILVNRSAPDDLYYFFAQSTTSPFPTTNGFIVNLEIQYESGDFYASNPKLIDIQILLWVWEQDVTIASKALNIVMIWIHSYETRWMNRMQVY
jgi:hypothetical protein